MKQIISSLLFIVCFHSLFASQSGGIIREAHEVQRKATFSDYDVDGMAWPYKYHVFIVYDVVFEDNSSATLAISDRIATDSSGQDYYDFVENYIKNYTLIPGDTVSLDNSYVSNKSTTYFTITVDRLKQYNFRDVRGYGINWVLNP